MGFENLFGLDMGIGYRLGVCANVLKQAGNTTDFLICTQCCGLAPDNVQRYWKGFTCRNDSPPSMVRKPSAWQNLVHNRPAHLKELTFRTFSYSFANSLCTLSVDATYASRYPTACFHACSLWTSKPPMSPFSTGIASSDAVELRVSLRRGSAVTGSFSFLPNIVQ